MSEVSKEQLSALLDGELAGEEVRFLLRRIQADPALAEVWARYQLIGDSLRGQVAMPVTSALAVRVMQRVQTEQINGTSTARPSRSRRWVRYGLGGSIAASVAVAALVWMQPRQNLPAPAAVAEQTMASNAPVLAARTETGADNASRTVAASVPDLSALLRQPGSSMLDVQPASALRSGRPILMQPNTSGVQPVWMRLPAHASQHQPETFYLRGTGQVPPREAAQVQLPPH